MFIINNKKTTKENNMNKLKKIGLTALAGSLVATSVFAGEMAVTGNAGMSFGGADKGTSANGFSMTDEITFKGSSIPHSQEIYSGQYASLQAPSFQVTDKSDVGIDVNMNMGGLFSFCCNVDMQHYSMVEEEPLKFSSSQAFAQQQAEVSLNSQDESASPHKVHNEDYEPCCFDFYLRPFRSPCGN